MSARRGMYFTLDGVFGAVIIISAVIIFLHYTPPTQPSGQLASTANDALTILNTLQVSELEPGLQAQLLATNQTLANDSVLRAIMVLWATNDPFAQTLTDEVFKTFFPKYSLAVYAEGSLLYNNSLTPQSQATLVASARQQVSGVAQGLPVSGTTATAFLRKIENKSTEAFTYFGGFVGQGNITVVLDLPSDVASTDVLSLLLELDSPGDFDLEINGVNCGSFSPTTPNMSADQWDITSCTASLLSGANDFRFEFDTLSEAYIAGGYIKATFTSEEFVNTKTFNTTRYDFPDISGVVNLYDAIIVPQTLTSLEAYLHYETYDPTVQSYLTIGEKTVWLSNQTGVISVTLNDTNFSNLPGGAALDYSFLSNKTVPIRFSSFNSSYVVLVGGNADIVVVTDYSGSMKKDIDSWSQGTAGPVDDCADVFVDDDIRRTHLARCLDKEVVNITIACPDCTGNRLWPVHYVSDTVYNYSNPQDAAALTGYYETWSPNFPQQGKDKTCLACALSEAYQIFNTHSTGNRTRFVILMSDGLPTHCTAAGCAGISRAYGAEVCDGFCDENGQNGCSNPNPPLCSNSGCKNAIDNTLFVAQALKDTFNATIYTVAYGPVGTCNNATQVLQQVANITNGSYYVSSDPQELQLIYQNISQSILTQLNLVSQTVAVIDDVIPSRLYGDSYILAKHDTFSVTPQQNEIEVTRQTPQFGSCTPTVNLPGQLRIRSAIVTSYSGQHWTDIVTANGQIPYNLSDFFITYERMGDPFRVNIPPAMLNASNSLWINTGDNITNSSGCSNNNTMVYTAYVPSATARTAVLANASGCLWTIEYDTGGFQSVPIPKSYSGGNACSYTNAGISYDSADALQEAVYQLLAQLDFDSDGRVFVSLSEEDLEIIVTKIGSVPYLWGPSVLEVRVWQ